MLRISALRPLLLLFMLIPALQCAAYQLSGTVTDDAENPLGYVSVYVENTTYGTATNIKGKYYLELDPGTYNIVFSFVGFEKKTVPVTITNKNVVLNTTMKENATALKEVTVSAKGKDPAYEIIKNAQKKRAFYRNQVEGYQCQTYIKVSLEKEYKQRGDSIPDSLKNKITRERMNMVESYSTTYYKSPSTFKEIKTAYRDLADKEAPQNVTVSFDYKDDVPPSWDETNPALFYLNVSDADFNFYKSSLKLPNLGETPYVSPIGASAMVMYKFRLDEMFHENGKLIHKIEVIPRFKTEALFSGYIYIMDGSWAIKSVDLAIAKNSLHYFKTFRVKQDHEPINDSVWVVSRREFFYTSREGRKTMIGNTIAVHSDYTINPEFPKKLFNNELYRTEDDAYDKDSTFWDSIRPITLKAEEMEFIEVQDSIKNYHESEEYLREQDSIRNHLNIWSFLVNGIYHRNRVRGTDWYISPLLEQIVPFGIGGYRHRLGGNIEKEWSKAKSVRLSGDIDYGFRNRDIKGEGEVSYLYEPKKFGRIYVGAGDVYDMVNTYESVQAIFSRSNYVRKTHFSAAHRMEYANGVYIKSGLEFSDRQSIEQLELDPFLNDLFGELNEPQPFDRYRVFLFDMKINLTFKQQYYTKPYKKVIVGSKYPRLNIHYKKGIPGVLNSEVDFDFLQLNLKHDFVLGTFGTSRYNITTGRFLRAKDLRFLEHKFFRGSDKWFFSNPLLSFQMLGPSLNTPNAYFQANYIHHFNGALLNKVPLINRLGLQTVGGAGALLIEDNNFVHTEAFVGIEWPFRLWKQVLKIGVYGSGSYDNENGNQLNTQIKFGMDFFNPVTNSWTY